MLQGDKEALAETGFVYLENGAVFVSSSLSLSEIEASPAKSS
jgi:hypothetical protein